MAARANDRMDDMTRYKTTSKLDFKSEDRLNKYIRTIDDKVDVARANGYQRASIPLTGMLADVEPALLQVLLAHYEAQGYRASSTEEWEGPCLLITWQ